ncbi:MAG: type III-B CRISPR module RAMP protein Cmr1 [Exilispira sp.]|jgi:CRISPR-associated protein Cmr1|nr:type III-B CRISPR module RAMP protein Cmr1 [Exilispira sp.]
MKEANLTVKVITPLFMGDAKQVAELRTQSINGILRWWFRAAGGSFEDEKRIFGWGGENSNKGGVKLVISQKLNYNEFEKEFDSDGRVKQDNGINYLGFSLDQRFNNKQNKPRRKCIEFNQNFDIKVIFFPNLKEEYIKKFFATLWFAFNLGNFGSRSRRGFGSLMIEKIESECKDITNNCFGLSFNINNNQNDVKKWITDNLNKIREIIKSNPRNLIPYVFSDNFKIYRINKVNKESYSNFSNWLTTAQKERCGKYLKNSWGVNNINTWQDLLDFMGFLIMAYRSYRKPDYDTAKNILKNQNIQNPVFERAIFGLSLNFFYSSLTNPKTSKNGYGDKIDLVEITNNREKQTLRRASPLMIKILKTSSNNYEGFFIVAKSVFKPNNSRLEFKGKEVNLPKDIWLAIDNFIDSLKSNNLLTKIK